MKKLILLLMAVVAAQCFGRVVAVKPYNGSPMIHVDGKPVSPLMFFGWESALSHRLLALRMGR
jgi:hypothetical protein